MPFRYSDDYSGSQLTVSRVDTEQRISRTAHQPFKANAMEELRWVRSSAICRPEQEFRKHNSRGPSKIPGVNYVFGEEVCDARMSGKEQVDDKRRANDSRRLDMFRRSTAPPEHKALIA